ncbi:MAG: hypothetical protein SFX18_15200 [Pirellulales bacterium]|nr:hypothetical protein [Pirellulales bacterium]
MPSNSASSPQPAPLAANVGTPMSSALAPAPLRDSAGSNSVAPAPLQTLSSAPRQSLTQVSAGDGSLPNAQGQVWREYNIKPYTERLATVPHPERAIVEWILRETGYEAWHGDVLSILNADAGTLRVYHTPAIQTQVNEIVDRFVHPVKPKESFGMRLVSVDSPAWRAKGGTLLRPLATDSPGIQAWVVAKEDAALLVAQARQRTDYREHTPPHLLTTSGRPLATRVQRPRSFITGYQAGLNGQFGMLPVQGKLEEGFLLEVTPLLSLDGKTVDAVVRCEIQQIEKMHALPLEIPTLNGGGISARLEVPQTCEAQLHERFRWNADQVLIVGLGVVPNPLPVEAGPLQQLIPTGPARVDLLLVIEPRGELRGGGDGG